MTTVELVGSLSIKFGREAYSKSFETVFVNYLTNTAAAVRDMGITQAELMGNKYGADWVVQ